MSLKATQWGPLLEARRDSEALIVSPERRAEARERLIGAPTEAREAWRYTSLKRLRDAELSIELEVEPNSASQLNASSDLEVLSLSELMNAPESADPLTARAMAWVRAELERAEPMIDLHTSLLSTGELVIVRALNSDTPAHQLVATRRRAGQLEAPSLWVYLEAGAELTLEERFSSETGGVTVGVTGLNLEAGARLEHLRAQVEAKSADASVSSDDQASPSHSLVGVHLGRANASLDARAHYALTTLNLGADVARVELDVALNAPEAHADLSGLYVGTSDASLDQHLTLRHQAPNCSSSQQFKGVLGERSRGVFTGKVVVAEGASSTTAHQHNPNLLLSDQASAVTRPQLEIYNDDVECSHGATVGQLDEDALFYLRARGLSEALALRALTAAFVGEVRVRLQDEALQSAIDVALTRALELNSSPSNSAETGEAASEMWIDWEALI